MRGKHYINKEKSKIFGCKVLILNALRKEKHISHFNLEEALQLIEELKPEKAYLTHLSHQMGKHAEVTKELPENVFNISTLHPKILLFSSFEIKFASVI